MDIFSNKVTSVLMWQKWSKLKAIIIGLPCSLKAINAVLGDARDIKLSDNSVDLLFISSPYTIA